MRGPWKDATSPTLTLEIEDPMVGEAAIEGWAPAIEQLRRLGQHRAPKDKVMLLVNASRLIERRLNKISRLHARLHAGESRRPIGADEYFPVLVYAVLQANPPQLLSTVTFISRFRSPEALRSLELHDVWLMVEAVPASNGAYGLHCRMNAMVRATLPRWGSIARKEGRWSEKPLRSERVASL